VSWRVEPFADHRGGLHVVQLWLHVLDVGGVNAEIFIDFILHDYHRLVCLALLLLESRLVCGEFSLCCPWLELDACGQVVCMLLSETVAPDEVADLPAEPRYVLAAVRFRVRIFDEDHATHQRSEHRIESVQAVECVHMPAVAEGPALPRRQTSNRTRLQEICPINHEVLQYCH